MEKIVLCKKCNRLIENKTDLITSMYVFEVVAYHEHCFVKDIKGAKSLFVSNSPLNGVSGNLWVLFSLIMAMGMLVFAGEHKIFAVFAVIPIIYRLYSYFTFERMLDQ